MKAETFAYDQLELTPEEFWALTPGHFNHLARAYYRRVRRQRERMAWALCILVNHYPMRGKNAKTLRVEQLIGHSPEQMAALEKKLKEARSKRTP